MILDKLRTKLPGDWQPAERSTSPHLIEWYAHPEDFAYLKIGSTPLYVGIRDGQFVIGTYASGVISTTRLLPRNQIAEQVVLLASHEGVMGRPYPLLPNWPEMAEAIKWRLSGVKALEETYHCALHNAISERKYLSTYLD